MMRGGGQVQLSWSVAEYAGFATLVAVTVTGPGFSPLTSPEELTLATCASVTVHVTPCGALGGCTVAWSCNVVERTYDRETRKLATTREFALDVAREPVAAK